MAHIKNIYVLSRRIVFCIFNLYLAISSIIIIIIRKMPLRIGPSWSPKSLQVNAENRSQQNKKDRSQLAFGASRVARSSGGTNQTK